MPSASSARIAVHDRMPVVLALELYPRWLSGEHPSLSARGRFG